MSPRRRTPGIRPRKTRRGEVWDARVRDIHGVEVTKTFTVKADAVAWRTTRLRERQLGDEYQPPAPTHGEFRVEFQKRQAVGKRASTVALDELALAHLSDTLDPLRLNQIRAGDVEDEVYKLARTSPRVAQKALEVEKRLLRSARDRGFRVDEAVFRIRPPRYTTRQPVIRPYADCELVASFMPEGLCRMPLLSYLTGMRVGELCYADDGDVCLQGCQEEAAAHIHVRVGEGRKCKIPRVVVLSAAAARLVREQRLVRPNVERDDGKRQSVGGVLREDQQADVTGSTAEHQPMKVTGSAPRPVYSPLRSTLLFPRPGFPRWNKDAVGVQWRAALKHAGMEGWAFHALKHCFCTLALSKGVNPILIAKNAGHFKGGKPDPSLIWQRYGHLFSASSATEIAKLDEPAAAVETGAEEA